MALLLNLYNIKNTNGLFYYGIEYALAAQDSPDCVLVRSCMVEAATAHFPRTRIVVCRFPSFILEILKAWWSGRTIYTPSSHPIPFIDRQMIVLHDIYPFIGKIGKIKKWLFLLSANSSNCLLGYINVSDGLAFYRENNFAAARLIFAPNRFPHSDVKYRSCRSKNDARLIVGVVGTDSPKKNYANLFSAIQRSGHVSDVVIFVYGHFTHYYRQLKNDFPDIAIQLINSEQLSMPKFLAELDALVSVAENEGFGRPIASALVSGVPCFLLNNPVFKEFFNKGAFFFDDGDSLLCSLIYKWQNSLLHEVDYCPPHEVVDAFFNATKHLDNFNKPT